eukprot:2854431-Amphidinium_carterae.2
MVPSKSRVLLHTAKVYFDRRLQQTLLRRALAYGQVGLLDFKLFTTYYEAAADSVLNADRAMFVRLAEETRSDLKPTAGGRPLDAVSSSFSVSSVPPPPP